MRPLPSLLAALLLVASCGIAGAATLKPHGTIAREMVQLGDLFEDVPAEVAQLVVGRAPKPGSKLTFNAVQLADIASSAQIGWEPPNRFVSAEIERESHTIAREQILAALRPVLIERGMAGDSIVALDNELQRITVAAERPSTIAFEDMRYEPSQGRFQAMVVAPAGEPDAVKRRISGRVVQTILLPVPSRPIAAGEIIKVSDIQLMRIRMDRAGNTVMGDPDRLIGRTAKRMLLAQEPIQTAAIGPTVIVPKNSIAMVRVISGRILITMEGKALDDGAIGDSIRVANPRSNKVVQGIVTAAGEVTLHSNVSLAAAR